MLLGPTGVGKSILGYSFLSLSRPEERGLLFSFYETPKAALEKGRGIGLDLVGACERGDLEMIWQSPVETSLDVIGGRVLEAVDRAHVKRAFVDGFNALQGAAAYPERIEQFFGALTRELRGRGVTTLYAAELHDVFAPQIEPPVGGISPLLDNLILLRFVEARSRLLRVVSVLKTRDSAFDAMIREFSITDRGVQVGEGLDDAEGVLTGVARERAGNPRLARRKEARPKRRRARSKG
jgi:circadian clock protein KaiC